MRPPAGGGGLASFSARTSADVFRLADWPTIILATERFVETAGRLKLDGVVFRELPPP
ncbi:double-CXXCG motif protein [Myxococcus sp. RHSTA-1-4]|uniref:double-CXXCG motif protein n=1 Tax=Myxococcus sp. RHSTA-1-4 TaxID=2874601 RepID=UPI001CBF5F7E|nr:double-CXXCG motif protein [Myxococcus sp. RHSTA-1-4]MBZ4420414.1 double-CXXCG motif protein [Myxococcus sp. RHSTA-1-4]